MSVKSYETGCKGKPAARLKLDAQEAVIRGYLAKGINKLAIAKLLECAVDSLCLVGPAQSPPLPGRGTRAGPFSNAIRGLKIAMMPALAVVTTAGSVTAAYGVGNCAIMSWTRHMPRRGMVRGKQSPAHLALLYKPDVFPYG